MAMVRESRVLGALSDASRSRSKFLSLGALSDASRSRSKFLSLKFLSLAV